MSIIFDALKKSDNNPDPQKKPAAAGPRVQVTQPIDPGPKPKKPPFAISKLFLPILFIGSITFFIYYSQGAKTPAKKSTAKKHNGRALAQPSRENTRPSEAATPAPVKTYSFSDFILEGIIYQENDPVAIINSKVLRVGETIKDYRVESISQQKVILRDDDGKSKELVF